MSADSKKKPEFTSTSVDLGEDLLNKSPQSETSYVDTSAEISGETEDLQRAKILMNERLFEDAKKIYRKILRKNPAHPEALEKIELIQRIEIKELLTVEPFRKKLNKNQNPQEQSVQALRKLEKELRTSLEKTEISVVPILFKTEESLEKYTNKILSRIEKATAEDKKDLGIGFLEMGLFELAIKIFESIEKNEAHRSLREYLVAVALIHAKREAEATIRLAPVVRDLSISDEIKIDFLYLMGMAFERLGDSRKAREFFRQVYKQNPKYRSVEEKVR